MNQLSVLILAAGKGTRLKSALPKVLHCVAGKPLLEYVLDAALELQPATLGVVVGHEAEQVKARLARYPVQFIEQIPQLGTGHAVQLAQPFWASRPGSVLILSGDVPLIATTTLRLLIETHWRERSCATLLSTILENPTGYGRVLRSISGSVERIIEQKDGRPEELKITEINSGIYCFETAELVKVIGDLSAGNAQKEYYLTDCIGLLREQNSKVGAVICADHAEVAGINSRVELAHMEQIIRDRKNRQLMLDGVTLIDPNSTYIAPDAQIGPDTVIYPNVCVESGSSIGANCEIRSNARITRSVLEDHVLVLDSCVIFNSHIQSGSQIGPFAHLRTDVEIGREVKIGNFVELKKASLGDGSKASHLSYLGDASVGSHVNVGAGTITCNYDGVSKSKTTIEDDVFIGSDSQLVAPVVVRRGAFVAAGSTITDEVPEDALAIARARQITKKDWVKKRRDSLKKR